MNAKLLVQALKSSKAQVLMAFLFAGRAMDNQEIREWTGLERKTVDSTVASLIAMGLLGKQMAAHGRPIYVPAGDVLPLFQMSEKWISEPVVVVEANSKALVSSITTITTIPQMVGKRTSEEQAALQAVLNEYKIVGRMRGQLIACEWVTAEYVRAHVEGAIGENNWDQPVGMAITRMLENTPAPEVKANGSKYTGGRYADFIQS
jgi:predicted DNA-binding transcriptional regulator